MIEINFEPGKGVWAEGEYADKLRNNFFGEDRGGKLWLLPEEALYIIDLQNGVAKCKGKDMGFSGILAAFAAAEPRLMIKYNAFRDWRDRGLIIKRLKEGLKGRARSSQAKKYPSKSMDLPPLDGTLYWDSHSALGVIESGESAKVLFEKWWLGQSGVYKQDRGTVLKLNFFEAVLLSRHFGLKVFDTVKGRAVSDKDIMEDISGRREFAPAMYQAYEDWRLRGYIVKTGFKFGTHFRIYFPGASPVAESESGNWIHSKHVLHIFPKEEKMLISEWARAVRVAHGVKKTFILGIPRLTKKDFVDYPADFVGFRRKKQAGGWVRETPADGPRYLVAAVSEEEHIGGVELASLLHKAEALNLGLILSITDRETAITYYALNKISLEGAKHDYYEIEWMRP